MSLPLISIALCTYQGERFLPEQLDSLLRQDYPSLEIIAVDDASQDRSFDILQQCQQRDSRLRVYRNPKNLGFTQNFQRAIQLSSGELIAPSDQDDIWSPDKLSRLAAARSDAALIYCDSLLIDEHGRDLGLAASDRVNMYSGSDPRPFLFHNCVSGHALLCTRELVNRAMPFPEGSYYDWWLALVAAATGRIEYLAAALVRFRQHQTSSTDLSGRKQDKSRPAPGHGLTRAYQQLKRLRRLKELPDNLHREFFEEAHALFENWQHSYFSPRLLRFIYRQRRALFLIKNRSSIPRPLDYFVGLKLKRVVKSYKYREPGAR